MSQQLSARNICSKLWHGRARQLQAPPFPPEFIAHAVLLYFRFPPSLRLVEEMLLEGGIVVSCEAILVRVRSSLLRPCHPSASP
jgi:transposase-like protein